MSAFTQQRISSEVSILSGSLLFQWKECESNNHSFADEEGRRKKITIEDQRVRGENGRRKTTNISNNGIYDDDDNDDKDGCDKDGKKPSYTWQDISISYCVKRILAFIKSSIIR